MYSALRDAALLVLMVTAHFLLPVFALRPVGPFPPLRPDVNKSFSSKPLQLTGDFLSGFVFVLGGVGGVGALCEPWRWLCCCVNSQ